MAKSGYLIAVYAAYAAVSVGLTVYLARTLFRNGVVFLQDVFDDKPGMADAVNRLLVIGFYLLNLGYACLILRTNTATSAVRAIELLSAKLGLLLASLAVLHFANMYLFYRIRRNREMALLPPPVAPQVQVPPPPPTWGYGGQWAAR